MRILCLQITRLGDIYQTIPTVRGLLRSYPEATVDLVVRTSFASGIPNLGPRVRVIGLPISDFVQPMLREHTSAQGVLAQLDEWIEGVRREKIDFLVNLSFSPLSSYLTFELADPDTVVRGYSRTTDGFLDIRDESSAYVYAQVGVGRPNRIHISDVFSMVAGIDLTDDDFKVEPQPMTADVVEILTTKLAEERYVVFHVGASGKSKTLSAEVWRQLAVRAVDELKLNVVLVGAKHEAVTQSGNLRAGLIDLCGKTNLVQLRTIVAHATALVGGDSLGVQIASWAGIPAVNISTSTVNFWETGPRSAGSVILWYPSLHEVPLQHVLSGLKGVLESQVPILPYIRHEKGFGMIYSVHGYQLDEWEWDLVRGIYSGCELPLIENSHVQEGFARLQELAELGLEQIETILKGKDVSVPFSVLNEIDYLVTRVLEFCPEVAAVVRWFQTEKSMIGPGGREQVLAATQKVFQNLKEFCVTIKVSASIGHELGQEASWK